MPVLTYAYKTLKDLEADSVGDFFYVNAAMIVSAETVNSGSNVRLKMIDGSEAYMDKAQWEGLWAASDRTHFQN